MLSGKIVLSELQSRGLRCEVRNISLTGGDLQGVVIETGDARGLVMFPIDSLLAGAKDVMEAADYIHNWLMNSLLPEEESYAKYLTKDMLLENAKLAVGRKQWEPFLFRTDFDDLIDFCYVDGVFRKMYWRIEVTAEMLDHADLSEDELFEAAKKNTFTKDNFKWAKVTTLLPESVRNSMSAQNPVNSMYSITTKGHGFNGAVQFFNLEELKKFTKVVKNDRLVVYLQSENNFIVAPYELGITNALKNVAENDVSYPLVEKLFLFYVKENELKIVQETPFRRQ